MKLPFYERACSMLKVCLEYFRSMLEAVLRFADSKHIFVFEGSILWSNLQHGQRMLKACLEHASSRLGEFRLQELIILPSGRKHLDADFHLWKFLEIDIHIFLHSARLPYNLYRSPKNSIALDFGFSFLNAVHLLMEFKISSTAVSKTNSISFLVWAWDF